ncbi:MAG: glycosyltransferase family 4 protein [Candidatus Solibacter usitatus]|nr:glycosyltransferase family 4 protein [Candidatus Solibacter usitatus]
MSARRILYLAAHGGFAGENLPLGGGAAVSELLLEEWGRRGLEVKLISPAVLGGGAPGGRELVEYNERQYAAFCDAFREASTEEALRHDPATTSILVNDISEGPDFARLRAAGFRVVTIYHVDVVAYIAAIYLRGVVGPAALARTWEGLRAMGAARIAPRILRLIFEQQRASLEYSNAVVVPSVGMKEILLAGYRGARAERIHVVGWGAPPAAEADPAIDPRREYGAPDEARVLLCLSRISPEKGQDRLLESLLAWEESGRMPERPVWLFICGEAAFMNGRKHMEKLQALAARLKRIRVVFPGYVAGGRKRAFFAMADLYVFPSRHESYGLTLMEALNAGLPAVCVENAGSREIMTPELGVTVQAGEPLWPAIAGLLEDEERRAGMGRAAVEFAAARPFRASAARLAELLLG